MVGEIQDATHRVIEQSGYGKEVIGLAVMGVSHQEIANKFEEWTGRPIMAVTVGNYLKRTLGEAGKERAVQLQAAKDVLEVQVLAKQQMDEFKREISRGREEEDWKRMHSAASVLMNWFDRKAKLDGLYKPETMIAIQNNVSAEDKERDALVRAVKEVLANHPLIWGQVLSTAKKYANEYNEELPAEWTQVMPTDNHSIDPEH